MSPVPSDALTYQGLLDCKYKSCALSMISSYSLSTWHINLDDIKMKFLFYQQVDRWWRTTMTSGGRAPCKWLTDDSHYYHCEIIIVNYILWGFAKLKWSMFYIYRLIDGGGQQWPMRTCSMPMTNWCLINIIIIAIKIMIVDNYILITEAVQPCR